MGTRFGDYEVLTEVARGSTGVVFKARHTGLDRVAAIKQLSPVLRDQPGLVDRLRSEASVLAGLSHPNIVGLYDFVEEPERVWLAEQWIDGATVSAILEAHGPISPEQSLGVVRGAMIGLAHAHDQGVVHRDVSSSNILADMSGTSMLVDFGLAGPAGSGTGAATGTPAFLSPEAARGEEVDKRGDVYSAAAVLYLLLTGTPVFAGPAPQVVRQHLESEAPRLAAHGSDLEALMARSLAKDPADRPQDAGEFLASLEEAARRRFGDDWLARASIAGIVGTVVAAAVSAAGGATLGAAPATIFVDSALGGLPGPSLATAVKKTRSLSSKVAMTVGAGVVVVGVVAGAVVASNDDSGEAGGTSGSSTAAAAVDESPSESPSPTIDPVVDLAPSGKWKLTTVTVKSTNRGAYAIGGKDTRTWRMKLDCGDASSCGGTIKSSSGSTFDYEWNGRSLRVIRPKAAFEGLCYDQETGEEMPGTHYKETYTLNDVVLRPTKSDADGKPLRLEGTSRVTHVVSELRGNCENSYANTGDPSPTVTDTYTLRRE